jgi:uncharacterized membrane protein YhaH (DUF805 family)
LLLNGNGAGMRCPECGKWIQQGLKFCGHCGFTLNEFIDSGDGDQSGLPAYQDSIEAGSVQSSRVSFQEAVKLGLRQYAYFRGRSSRAEFWWWMLFNGLAVLGSVILDSIIFGEASVFYALTLLALIIPTCAVTVRRLHDRNKSAWWFLLGLVPLANIALLVFYMEMGDSGSNRFGPNPRNPNTQ